MSLLEILFYIAELLAAIFGTVFITKYRVRFWIRYFVYFLWLNFLVESFGKLPDLIYKFENLSFLENTFLSGNAWMYNIFTIVSYIFYILFFKSFLATSGFKNTLKVLVIVFFLTSVSNLIFTDVFFKQHSPFPMILGTLILVFGIFLYFFEMLKSEKILEFKRDLVFYIAIGALVFHLCVPPLFIFRGYYSNSISPDFVKIHQIILYSAIIFMYTCYALGFMICYPPKKQFQESKSYS